MTKKKHKVLPPDMLDSVKYEIALELGLMPGDEDGGSIQEPEESHCPDVIVDGLPEEDQSK